MLRTILGAGVVTIISMGTAHALPEVFFETETEHCTISAAVEPKSQLLRLDMTHKIDGRNCALTQEETVELFANIFKARAETGDRKTYSSLMIGDVGDYAWMQRYLMETARADPAWSQATGRPKTRHANHYVNAVLSRPAVIDVFSRAGSKYDYRFTGMDCEKVFISDDGLPVDAFCWAERAQK